MTVLTPLIEADFEFGPYRLTEDQRIHRKGNPNADQYSNGMSDEIHPRGRQRHEEPQTVSDSEAKGGSTEGRNQVRGRRVEVSSPGFLSQVEIRSIEQGPHSIAQGVLVNCLPGGRAVIRCNGEFKSGKLIRRKGVGQ